MHYDQWSNLVAMFFDVAGAKGDAPFAWARTGSGFTPLSWTAAAAQVNGLSASLRRLGVQPGDRVVLVAENRPEWAIADLAIMAAGGVSVPAYITNTAADHRHVLTDSGAKGAIVSTAALARALVPGLAEASEARFLIAMEPVSAPAITCLAWAEAVAAPPAAPAAPGRDDTACLIYTSGTGGLPKGVMLSHGAILSNCMGAYELLLALGLDDEVFLSFLPLSHAYEHTCGLYFPISIGAQIYFTDAEHLAGDLTLARPTIMTAVPRLYETLYQRITRGVRRAGGVKRALFRAALRTGRERYLRAGLGPAAWLVDRLAEVTVRRAVRAQFGGRLKALVSGGAALDYDIGLFFTALGLRLLQGYGQTEAAPVVSCNRPERNRLETVGPPLKGVEVRIAEDGEILVRGELLMKGYWNNPDATEAALRDGWLHTGDIGAIDPDGAIRITDRKKDIIVLSGGDNVAPQRVEGRLTAAPEIAMAMVCGDRRPHLVALIVADAAFAESWARERGHAASLADLIADPAFIAAMDGAVARVNRELSPTERVRRFLLVAEPFSFENGMMTPTLKIRRHHIRARYGDALDALYRG